MIKKALLAFLLLSSCTLLAQQTFLHCGTLIDIVSAQPMQEATIVVENDRIIKVEKGYTKAPADAKVVDLKNATVMPIQRKTPPKITGRNRNNHPVMKVALPAANKISGTIW